MEATASNERSIEASSARKLMGTLTPNNVDMEIAWTNPSIYNSILFQLLLSLPSMRETREASPPTSNVSFRVSG